MDYKVGRNIEDFLFKGTVSRDVYAKIYVANLLEPYLACLTFVLKKNLVTLSLSSMLSEGLGSISANPNPTLFKHFYC